MSFEPKPPHENPAPQALDRRTLLKNMGLAASMAALSSWSYGTRVLAAPLTGNKSSHFSLVQNGKPQCTIVTADNPDASVQEAAAELNYWIKRISGATLPITTAEKFDATQPYIAIGASALTQSNGWLLDDLGYEDARVIIEPGRIGLLGQVRDAQLGPGSGVYYAVLELVRHALGVRWIWPGELGEVFKSSPNISVPVKSWTWRSQLPVIRRLRSSWSNSGFATLFGAVSQTTPAATVRELDGQQNRWLQRQRMNETVPVPIGGSMPFKGWWDRYSKEHPDWFAKPPAGITQAGGHGVKLNLSNPEVHEQILKVWQLRQKKDPQRNRYFSLSPNDSRGFDTRPETRAWDPPELSHYSDQEIWNGSEPVLTDRYVRFWNTLVGRMKQQSPQATVVCLAYRNYRQPPLMETVDENVLINYVGGEGYYPDEPSLVKEWKAWSAKGARKKLWRPNLLHCGHGIPYLFSKQLYQDFQQILRDGLLGTDFDSLKSHWANQGLNYYLLAEMHYRPEATYEELTSEYFQAFGSAAPAMKAYHEFFEQVTTAAPGLMRRHKLVSRETWGGWWEAHIRVVPLLLTPDVMAQGDALLRQAEAASLSTREKERVSFVRRGFDHSRLMAETFAKVQFGLPSHHAEYAAQRETLRPLWEARQKLMGDFAVPVEALFHREQLSFGLWDGFIKEQKTAKATTIALDEGWKIKADTQDEGLTAHWEKAPSHPGEWKNAVVGQPWRARNGALEPTPGATKVVWYYNRFELPILDDTAGRVLLTFGAIDAEAHIWVNGKLVTERSYPHQGNYDSWKEPFEVNITNAVKQGPDNVLMIRVRSEQETAGINGKVALVVK